MSFEIQVESDAESTRISLAGPLTIDAHGRFIEALKKISAATRPLVIDLGQLDSIDSAGLGMLLLAKELSAAPRARIDGAQGGVRRALEIAHFGQLFEIS